jgi:two-component system phosphate regulon response regulator PhoB
MARILVIEDEQDLQKILQYNFTQAGHEVLQATEGREGLRMAQEGRPDLVLLDLMLPDISGTEVCRSLKSEAATRHVPVIMLTAKGEELDRVVGFELGAEDYIVKPFSARELLLRVQVILRRTRPAPEPQGPVAFGRLRFDSAAHRAWVDGAEIDLTPLELKLLATLYERRNRVQTRAALLDKVWGISADLTTRTVDTHVRRLREKLGPAADYVETVRGVGYRFVGEPDGDGD